jgi:hypothetical protein
MTSGMMMMLKQMLGIDPEKLMAELAAFIDGSASMLREMDGRQKRMEDDIKAIKHLLLELTEPGSVPEPGHVTTGFISFEAVASDAPKTNGAMTHG